MIEIAERFHAQSQDMQRKAEAEDEITDSLNRIHLHSQQASRDLLLSCRDSILLFLLYICRHVAELLSALSFSLRIFFIFFEFHAAASITEFSFDYTLLSSSISLLAFLSGCIYIFLTQSFW
jgi:hypothetical protein